MTTWQLTLGLAGLALAGTTLTHPLVGAPTDTLAPEPLAPTPAVADGAVSVALDLDRAIVAAGRTEERFLTVRLTPKDLPVATTHQPVHVVAVVDTSGSMSGGGKIDQARRATAHLTGALGADDRFTLVTFSDNAQVAVPTVRGPSARETPWKRLLFASGGTNLHGGLSLGAQQHTTGVGRTRVVLLSDGHATSGPTDPGSILSVARRAQAHGISVTAIGLGLDFDEDLVAGIADAGGGSYAFVDASSSLSDVFSAELDRSARLVAQQATVDLLLGEGVQPVEVVGWEGARIDGGWRVPVGDLYAGEERQIVVRVRVTGRGDAMTVGEATARYIDATDATPRSGRAKARVEVSADVAQAEGSVLPDVAAYANRAWGNVLRSRSARAYADGDLATAADEIEASREALNKLRALGYADVVAAEMEDLEAQVTVQERAAPASSEGKALIKKTKEEARDRARSK